MKSLYHLAVAIISLSITTSVAGQEAVTPPVAAPDQWEYQLALSHPLSSRADLTVSQTFSQVENEALSWSAIHLVLAYQLTSAPVAGFSPALTLDYERGTSNADGNVLVTQLAFSRELGATTLTLAPLYEYAWAQGEGISSCGIDCCLSHALGEKVSLGLESHWKTEIKATESADLFLVPTAGFSSGSMNYSLGLALGLDESSDEPLVRFALGLTL